MATNSRRRNFLKSMIALPALASTNLFFGSTDFTKSSRPLAANHKLKISLNAFSFNDALSNGSMTLDELLEYCSGTIIEAVDLTGYYFPGYPSIPPDEYIHHIKHKAFRLGLGISGTGVRNDFTEPDTAKRRSHVSLVKNWIECAAKLGAPVIRIFAGTQNPGGYNWDQVAAWMMKDVQECVEHGKRYGVIVGIQNHNDFIKTASDAEKIMKMNTSEWFGLILDTGSYQSGDPYKQIADTAKYAVNWQLKENVFLDGVETPADIDKIIAIIKASGYRGYVPLETLGKGDPKQKLAALLEKVEKALESQ